MKTIETFANKVIEGEKEKTETTQENVVAEQTEQKVVNETTTETTTTETTPEKTEAESEKQEEVKPDDGNIADINSFIDEVFDGVVNKKEEEETVTPPQENQETTKEVQQEVEEVEKKVTNDLDKISDLDTLKEQYVELASDYTKLSLNAKKETIAKEYLERQLEQANVKIDELWNTKKNLEREKKVTDSKDIHPDLIKINDYYRLFNETGSTYNMRYALEEIAKLGEKVSGKDLAPFLLDVIKEKGSDGNSGNIVGGDKIPEGNKKKGIDMGTFTSLL